MKNIRLLSGILLLTIVSCNTEIMSVSSQPDLSTYIITKSSAPDPYYVTTADLKKYVGRSCNILDIQEYKDDLGITCLYAVNFKEGGFKIVSADKRSTILLGDSEKGYMDFANLESNTAFWIESCSHVVKDVSLCDSLTEEMQYNVETWDFITGRNFAKTRAMRYVYLVKHVDNYIGRTTNGPYVSTRWGQGNHYRNDYFWNRYSPWIDSTMVGRRSPVGCTAVAGCQLAYHMKDYPGVNILIPTSASCTGYSGKGNYQQSFSSDLIPLGELPLDYNETDTVKIEKARIFLAYTGHLMNMEYLENGATAKLDSLSNVLKRWGIDNSLVNYSDSIVKYAIYKNEPLIAIGLKEPDENGKQIGHAWIIDGYQICKVIRQNYYYMSDTELSDSEYLQLTIEDCNGYDEWQMPDMIRYHMNWGANGRDDGWLITICGLKTPIKFII